MKKLVLVTGIACAIGGAVAGIAACGGDDSAGGTPDASSDGATVPDTSGGSGDGGTDADATTSQQGDGGLITTASDVRSDDLPVVLLRQADGKYVAVASNTDHYGVVMARVTAAGALDPTFGQGGIAWGQNTYGRAGALQSDGKIVVAGYVGIARYDATGTEDTSFKPPTGIGSAGVVNVEGIAIQPDGKILAAGTDGSNLRVQRLLPGGAYDTGFDTDGSTTVSFGSQSSAYAVTVDATSGKIAAVGYAGGQLALAVFNPDGSPDTTFNTTGFVTGAGLLTGSQGWAVAFQSDGKIVVGGSGSGDGGAGAMLVRYTTAGLPDATFGAGGVFYNGLGGAFQSVRVRPSGAIVAGRPTSVVQVTSTGTLDATFGTGGIAPLAGLPQSGQLSPGVALAPDGTLAGLAALDPGDDSTPKAIFRLTAAGALDTSFGTGGEVSFSFHARQDEAHTMLAQPDGKVVVGGRSTGAGMIARYLPSGALDTGFADGGVRTGGEEIQDVVLGDGGTIYIANGFGAEALTPSGAHDSTFNPGSSPTAYYLTSGDWFAPRAVALDGQGRILLAGYGGGARPEHVGLIRFLPNGQRDSTFGTGGVYEGPTDNERIFAVAVDSMNRVVLGGFSGAGASASQKILLMRLDANGALDATFDGDTGTGDGITYPTTGETREMARGLAIQPDGKILVLANTKGEFYDTYDYGATAVLRIGTDGKLDTSFGTGGIVTNLTGFYARGMELRPDGSILLAGTHSDTTGAALAAMRLTPAGAVDATFGTGGTYVASATPSGGWAIATPPGADPWLAGFAIRSPTGSDFALTRAK